MDDYEKFTSSDLWIIILVICYIAIENGPVEIVNCPIKNGDFA